MYTEQDNWHIKQEVTARTVCIHGIHVYGIYGMQAARTLTTSGIAGGGGGALNLRYTVHDGLLYLHCTHVA